MWLKQMFVLGISVTV